MKQRTEKPLRVLIVGIVLAVAALGVSFFVSKNVQALSNDCEILPAGGRPFWIINNSPFSNNPPPAYDSDSIQMDGQWNHCQGYTVYFQLIPQNGAGSIQRIDLRTLAANEFSVEEKKTVNLVAGQYSFRVAAEKSGTPTKVKESDVLTVQERERCTARVVLDFDPPTSNQVGGVDELIGVNADFSLVNQESSCFVDIRVEFFHQGEKPAGTRIGQEQRIPAQFVRGSVNGVTVIRVNGGAHAIARAEMSASSLGYTSGSVDQIRFVVRATTTYGLSGHQSLSYERRLGVDQPAAPSQECYKYQNGQCNLVSQAECQGQQYPNQSACCTAHPDAVASCSGTPPSSGTGTTPGQPVNLDFSIQNPIAATDFLALINQIAQWVVKIAIPIAVVFIVYAGFKFLMARGDTTKVTEARKMLLYVVIGLAIILIGTGFVSLIKSILELGG